MREINHIGEIVELVDKIQTIQDLSVPVEIAVRDLINEPVIKPFDNLEDIHEETDQENGPPTDRNLVKILPVEKLVSFGFQPLGRKPKKRRMIMVDRTENDELEDKKIKT